MRFGNLDSRSVIVARAFFHAATKLSDDDEDILPQEDSADGAKLSVYGLFSELFPEHVVSKECGSISAKAGLTRLQFNKLGYEIYVKEQSRRVPAPRAKPGNPGYGFRRAKWRNVSDGAEDQSTMQETLQAIGVPRTRCEYVRMRIDQYRIAWEYARRPSRPAGPGRPRGRARGDKAEGNSPEPADNHVDGMHRWVSGLGAVGAPVGRADSTATSLVDGAAWRYANQIEQLAAIRGALGHSQQQHGGGAALGPAGLLLQHASAALQPQQLRQAVAGGMSKMLFLQGASQGTQWPAGVPVQQPGLAGISLGLASGAGGACGSAHFTLDTLKQLEQQQQQQQQRRLAAGAAALGSSPRSAEMEVKLLEAAILRGVGNLPLAGLATGFGFAGCGGGAGGTWASCGAATDLSLRLQTPWQVGAPQQGQQAASKRSRSEGAGGEDDEGGGDERGSEEKEEEGEHVEQDGEPGGRAKRLRRAAGCSSYSAALGSDLSSCKAETLDTSATLAQMIFVKDGRRGSGSSSALTSSASTSVANSPAVRAIDKSEPGVPLATAASACPAHTNKAALTNLLTGTA